MATPTALHYDRDDGGIRYVALGDSFAAGQGGGAYLNSCKQTRGGYPALLDRAGRIRLVSNQSCSGATTSDVLRNQLGALNGRVGLVTVTVGGNDLNTGGIALACSPDPSTAQCQSLLDQAQGLLASGELARRLGVTFAAIAADAPHARLLVTGYPILFEPPAPGNPAFVLISTINAATAALNSTIAAVVGNFAAAGVHIQFVDVVAAFAGHGVGSVAPWVNASGPDALHPNPAGYRAYARALRKALSAVVHADLSHRASRG